MYCEISRSPVAALIDKYRYLCVGVVEVVDGHLLVLIVVVLVSVLLLVVVLISAPLWLACNDKDCKYLILGEADN